MLTIKNNLSFSAMLAQLSACLAFLVFTASAAEPGSKTIEWSDLVAKGWEAPIILPAPEADGHYPVDTDSLVYELDKQLVALAGYMMPVRFEQNVVFEFLFVPYLAHHAKSHVHHDANQMIYVQLVEPVAVENPFAAWYVQGQLRVESVTTDDGRTGYTLRQAQAVNYKAADHAPAGPVAPDRTVTTIESGTQTEQ